MTLYTALIATVEISQVMIPPIVIGFFLANVIRRCTGIKVHSKILKYSGRPFSPEEIVANFKEEAKVNV